MKTVQIETLPRHFDSSAAEDKWARWWEETGIYHYDPGQSRKDTFVVDTPPPTVSGSLHLGHVFSYTHTDILARYQRMTGRNIFYPMGWDDNGLPTERRVQNLYHVRCSPDVEYQEARSFEPASAKKRKKERAELISRRNFIELCQKVTLQDEREFKSLWTTLGLSVDWREEYSTINDRSRLLAQLSFYDLYEKGHIYNEESPMMWDVTFQTAVAQAEVEDREVPGAYHFIRFGVSGDSASFTIATTRPELLAACVGVAVHPNDSRYAGLIGRQAVTPLFQVEVPIFASKKVDPEKGTGILMVCTFGDALDVEWWKEEQLLLRQVIRPDGRLEQVDFGSPGWESKSPQQANRFYAELSGKGLKAARRIIQEQLAQPQTGSGDSEPPLEGDIKAITHPVRYYEKGDLPLEYLTTRQWFVRLLDKKEQLLEMGDRIHWHPSFMAKRYRDWTENLQYDWCISRQRFFGVPIPVWYQLDSEAQPIFNLPIIQPRNEPLDPSSDWPDGFQSQQRGAPQGFAADVDVFDTWFTSSLSPQIASGWLLDSARHQNLFPMDIRPQSHEIIRTWAFYTIAKALLHEDKPPWKSVLISGWILDPDRKKMSKSVGNVITPKEILQSHSSDSVRYWAGRARLGVDTAVDEQVFKIGKKLTTKLFNASKLVLSQTAAPGPIINELDLSFLRLLEEDVLAATQWLDAFEFARALDTIEKFFWDNFTDSYLELVKSRAGSVETGDLEGRGSAVSALRLSLSVFLRLFAPFIPFVTEDIWSWVFAEESRHPSIHRAPWPGPKDFAECSNPQENSAFVLAKLALSAIFKQRTESGIGLKHPIESVTILVAPDKVGPMQLAADDVQSAARAEALVVEADATLSDLAVQVRLIDQDQE